MRFIVWKDCPQHGGVVYLTGGNVWSEDKSDAKHYTQRGADSICGKLSKSWGAMPGTPKRYGYKYIEGSNQ